MFQVLPNSPFWPSSAHEPLLIGLIFPFTRANPWQLRGTPNLLSVGRELRNLQENKEMDRRDILRELWSRCHGLRNVPEHVVRRLLYFSPLPDFHIAMATDATGERDDEDRIESGWTSRKSEDQKFVTARDGDDLLVPFECDSCIVSKLYRIGLNTETLDEAQRFGLACIRRVNLDAFWSQASSTVNSNRYLVKSCLKTSTALGLPEGPYTNPGPLPNYDHCGYQVAMQMVAASLGSGRYSKSYKQWDMIRRVRSAFSSQYRTSAQANSNSVSFSDAKGASFQRLTTDPCG